MSEKDNLQNADGIEEIKSTEETTKKEVETPVEKTNVESSKEQPKESVENITEETAKDEVEVPVESSSEDKTTESIDKKNVEELVVESSKEKVEKIEEEESTEKDKDEHGVDEIEASNAEDAEDEGNKERHVIEVKDYHAMSMDDLVDELTTLVSNEKVQAIRNHVDSIKKEFTEKINHFLEVKKEEFISEGGNPIDFYFASPTKKRFNQAYKDFRRNLRDHYQNIEMSLKENLANRLEIIEELKSLINVEENINTTYKHFKELQERWKNAGPIPRDKYNNAWNTYHHHVEIFYDFLHLNRDLRDLDFKHNLEQKQKIVDRAEELAKEDDVSHSFRELQVLHKMWKEELGPVAKEFREEIWNKFKVATKTIHNKRQEYFSNLDKIYEKNLELKEDIISKITAISEDENSNHRAWQNKIKEIESLREDFFKAGKVPLKVNEATWAKFKESVRTFNRKKNAFYKGLKKEQYKNLEKKLDLIKVAEDNKDNDDFETITPLMKKIQAEWKKIGHVPRKDSDKIWKQFKTACNHYFDKLHTQKDSENKVEIEAFEKKKALLDVIKEIELSGNQKDDLKTIKSKIQEWKEIGRVPYNKRYIEGKFNKSLDFLFNKLDLNKTETELLKYDNKLESLNNQEDHKKLDNELFFIRKKVDEAKQEINQLENNLLFFAHVKDDNPVVMEVKKNIVKHKETLKVWTEKLKKIKSLY